MTDGTTDGTTDMMSDSMADDQSHLVTVAFVGLGNMGAPMAANLVAAGYSVIAIDADAARAATWAVDHSARSRTDLADVAEQVDFVITMLPTGAEVRSVLTAPEFVAAAKPSLIAIDMSSAHPVGTRELGDELGTHGIRMIDAPVSGGVQRAVAGTLAIMVGGPSDAIAASRPLLSSMGDRIFEVGGPGSGHAMKCLNNFVAGTAFVACSEALLVGRDFGLDPTVMMDVMNVSTGRNFNTDLVMKQHVISGEFASGFALGLLAKDVGIADDLAHAMGRPAPLADLVTARLVEARDALGAAVDHTRAHQHWSGD